jgi:hypothetical protein
MFKLIVAKQWIVERKDMISQDFKIREFVEAAKEKLPGEIVALAKQEIFETEKRSVFTKGAIQARAQGSLKYAELLKALIAFVNSGQKPMGVEYEDFLLFRPICEHLTKRGWFPQEVLKTFDLQ